MKKILYIIILLFCASSLVYASPEDSTNVLTRISGHIKSVQDNSINGANIVIEGTIDGATSDSLGYFEFETSASGKHNLIVTAIDYKEKFYNIDITAGKNIELNVKLTKEEVSTDEILVTASSYTSGANTQVTLTPLEIVRIPGSDADIYRAITTFPGSNQVDEGSRLTVRGGDASEVLTILDQASLYNPFIFDDDFNSSSYSTVNPWGLKGINFSSGGFSARYGNVLSAVLDLNSYEMPQQTGTFIFLGLANASIAGTYLSTNKKFGASLEASTTNLDPYFKINGKLGAEFNPIPLARGLGGTLSYKFGEGKYLKYYADYSYDRIGIRNTSPSYDGFFTSDTKTFFNNIKYSTGVFKSSFLSAGLSYSDHKKNIGYGILSTSTRDLYSKLRVDLTTPVSKKIEFTMGSEYEFNQSNFTGTLPILGYDLRINAPSFRIDSKTHTGRLGGYLESQFKISKNFFTVAGIRSDYHSLSKKWNFDPRISLGYKIAKDNVLRAAVGIYHQYPDLQYYAQSINNNLKPEEAVHYILGYELNKMEGLLMFRVEAYYKDYKNLVLLDSTKYFYNYFSGGTGRAKGVDVFLKSRITNKYSTWLSYAYTDSKRNQLDYGGLISADYDITHALTYVMTYNITDVFAVGMTYKISTGKPYTPVVGSSYDSTQSVYVPQYASRNSARFPTYQRWDMNMSYIFSLFGKFAIAVFQVNNILNHKNLYDYSYNSNYTQKIPVYTTNQRAVYFALGLAF
jgi:vitamin B12 transporter